VDDNQRAEYDRQEAARQAHAGMTRHERYCPSCSGMSPFGGLCSTCLANQSGGDSASWVVAAERYCPSCSGLSPFGGLCPTCLAVLAADAECFPIDSYSPYADDAETGNLGDYAGSTNSDAYAEQAADADSSPLKEDRGHGTPHDHHIFPRAFIEEFQKAGIDIDMYTATLYRFQHQIIHSEGWNDDWGMFFEMFEQAEVDPDVDDVMDFGVYMIEKYGLDMAIPHPYEDQSGELGDHLF
jgi:hypothetical protein